MDVNTPEFPVGAEETTVVAVIPPATPAVGDRLPETELVVPEEATAVTGLPPTNSAKDFD